jgi:hypothetical protein
MRPIWLRLLGVLTVALTIALSGAGASVAQDHPAFSPKDRQDDIGRLRDFLYPPGYSEQSIVALENGKVPDDMTVTEFARLHCGGSRVVILNPCLIRYRTPKGAAYFVVAPGGNKSFANAGEATGYFRDRMTQSVADMSHEIDALNQYIEGFCEKVENGVAPRAALAEQGERPRINHEIASPNPESKFQFSNLFQWEKCTDCVGIVAVSQQAPDNAPRCGQVAKQSVPKVNFFVVDRLTSHGYNTLDEGLNDFSAKVGPAKK